MKKIFTMMMAFMLVIAFGGLVLAAEEKKAAPPAKEAKPAPEKVMQATGDITAVDAKANTFTLKSAKKGEITCAVTADTKITMGKAAKTLADVKVGDKATCKYVEKEGKHVCKAMDIKAAAMKMEEKKEMKKEEPKKK